MLPSKLKALNDYSTDESSDNNDVPIKITKEVLETKAEIQYSQALQYLAKDKFDEAEEQLSRLLQSEIISSLNTRLDQKDKSQFLLAHLKYCCLTNLGNLLLKKSDYRRALIHYQEALNMDNTDLNLWYRIGLTHSKLYQTDQAISAFLEGIKCNPRHWPSLDKLITLLYASNEYVRCIYHISISLKLDPGYLKGHFIKEIIYTKFPSLISYFKSYCSNGGLDIECTDIIGTNTQLSILDEIYDIRNNDPTLVNDKNIDYKPVLFAKNLKFDNWDNLGKWLLSIYDYLFNNHDHSLLYEPIEFNYESLNLSTIKNCIIVDEEYCENKFEKPLFKQDVPTTKRRKSSPSLTDQIKLSRRSARNKGNSKTNESNLVKSIWNIMPQNLLNCKNDKLTINSIKWSDESMDTMDVYRLFEFSDILGDGHTENLLKNNMTNKERLKQINVDNYFGSDFETSDLNYFIQQNNKKSISDLLEIFIISIANKWSKVWPNNIVQIYVDIFQRVWIHTGKQQISHITDSNLEFLNDKDHLKIKDEIISIITYGELISDLYFQFKICNKPLEGSIIGGHFCSLWIGSITDALSILNLKDENMIINLRFLWLKVLFSLQEKETSLTYDVLEIMINTIGELDNYEIILPNLEYFYRINKKIAEKLIITLKRNYALSTVKDLYEAKEYLSVVDILKETLKAQCVTFMEIPSYQTMTRYNQYIFMLNSFLELKNYYELFNWCEACLYEAILQYRKNLIENCDTSQKTNQAEFINNIFYAMLESIKIEGYNVFDILSEGYKLRLIQSVINLLSYLENFDGTPEIIAVSPWLLLYNMLKYEEFKNQVLFSPTSIQSSLSLLILAHDYLGKRKWCCFENGSLLFLTLSEIEPYINLDFYTISLAQQVDQIFYCLYTHLIKRNKPRNVQDHQSMGLALTWSRSRQLIHFYQPQELPSYDSRLKKSFTINSDMEVMLKLVIDLIPEEIKPDRLIDDLMAYLRGKTTKPPINLNPLPDDVKDIFYLMADYNFKNNSWGKAIRYYILDLCNNLNRLDTWAGIALSKGSQIETKLNSCEAIKDEINIIRRAHMACLCYKHALKIDPENTTILIEYGTFAYSIHSFCSRLLKQETSSMSLQMFRKLEEDKEKMIKTAKNCFETANNVWENTITDFQDERWINHYILGKISEKNNDDPIIFMEHYIKAAQFLDSNGAKFLQNISYTTPQCYSIEILEIYYRIHAGTLKLFEKQENLSIKEELYTKIKGIFDIMSYMSSKFDNKIHNKISTLDINKGKKENIDAVIKVTINNIINHALKFDTEENKLKNNEWSFDNVQSNNLISEFIDKDISNIHTKKIKLVNDYSSTIQDTENFRCILIQKCLDALEDCIKRFPQHYKSYYRLAHFYFHSKSHRNYTKFKDIMFGEKGLFNAQKQNNFFNGVWRIPVIEIDRPGSFAYHMSRCIHLLLDFFKETGDHKSLLDLAIQLKYTPDREKKYLRDNEREDISKEALLLSVQILRNMNVQYVKSNNHNKNEHLLLQIYHSYKRVFKCWQKDNPFSKLLLDVYQSIFGIKDDVSNDVVIKYCQKLQARDVFNENKNTNLNNDNDKTPSITTPKSINYSDSLQPMSTKLSFETQSHSSSLNSQEISNQIMSAVPYIQSPLMFQQPQEKCSYAYTLQQKLQATKLKLKSKRSTTYKIDSSGINKSQKKSSSSNRSYESKIVRNQKLTNIVKLTKQNKSNCSNITFSKLNEFNSTNNLDSAVEIMEKLPNNLCNITQKVKSTKTLNNKPKLFGKHSKVTSGVSMSKLPSPMSIISTNLHNPKSKYIHLDSVAEQSRLKSTIIQNKGPEKKNTSAPLNPTMLLSSCPGLSITPVVNSNTINHKSIECLTPQRVQNTSMASKNINIEQLQHLGNGLTITKSEKTAMKIQRPN